MTKHELAKRVATDAGITAGQAASVVDAAFDTIAGELAAGRDVAIAGFGAVISTASVRPLTATGVYRVVADREAARVR